MRPPCSLLSCLLLLAGCGGGEADSAAGAAAQAPASPVDGREVYMRACALCHGDEGDGDGTVVLDRPARSFRDGGFSFGNTPEALYRTVSSGIGGTPMPGFATTLSEEELRAVVEHVIALGPEVIEVDMNDTVLAVGARAEVVRGGLPPLTEGGEVVPRGLLIGNTDGLSYEYDASDLRLLAVRQGAFVKRRDWGGRGGDLLEPLGQVRWSAPGEGVGDAAGGFAWLDGRTPLEARLAWTEIDGGQAEVGARLIGPAGEVRAILVERCSAAGLGELAGFRRSLRVEDGQAGLPLLLRLDVTEGLERLGKERVLVDGARGPVVYEASGAGLEGLIEIADGVLGVGLRLDAKGAAACEVTCIPLASREQAETLRQEGF